MKYILLAFLAYLLYKLVFSFIIPVYRASRKIKAGFKRMQEEMQAQQQQQSAPDSFSNSRGGSRNSPKKDYIDFEEIK